jgi:hypothetical protein
MSPPVAVPPSGGPPVRRRRVLAWWRAAIPSIAAAARQDPDLVRRYRSRLWREKPWRELSLQAFGKQHLFDLSSAAAEAGVRPLLFWGTLLGHVREAGFIAHDRDIDVMLLPEDVLRRERLFAAMRARGYRVAGADTEHARFLRPQRLIHIDVDLLVASGDQLAVVSQRRDGSRMFHPFPAAIIGEPRTATFAGNVPVWLPQDPETILTMIYGDWRTVRRGWNSLRDARTLTAQLPGA